MDLLGGLTEEEASEMQFFCDDLRIISWLIGEENMGLEDIFDAQEVWEKDEADTMSRGHLLREKISKKRNFMATII
jgi:hypothetical protein